MSTVDIAGNVETVRQRLRLAAGKYQREPDEITILAVSKRRPARDLRQAFECGLSAFGENYLQEALEKIGALDDLPLSWHFIGPIQSNKTRQLAGHFDWVHSVDRLKIARRLSEQRPPELAPLQICLQVNISAESSKSGVPVSEVPGLAREVMQLPRLRLRGLMAIPAPAEDESAQRLPFARLRELLQQLQRELPDGDTLDTLSMGMSADLEAAVAEGSTLVRIGTALFGPRS